MLPALCGRLPHLLADRFLGKAAFSSKDSPKLKHLLRDLYKKVHPDLFHGHPDARAANEKSFKLLQEYLSVSREGGSFGGIAGVPYRFEFYLHKESRSRGDSSSQGGVDRVALELPPPGRHGNFFPGQGSADTERLPPSAEKALGKLLDACGVPNPYKDADSAGSFAGHTWRPVTGRRLREFIPEAAEVLQQTEGAQFGPRQHLSAARTALRMTHQVSAEFAGSGARLPAAEKAAALQKLGNALDRVQDDVNGLRFILCDAYGMDGRGRIRLLLTDTALLWTAFLLQMDLDSSRKQLEAASAMESLEQSVASSLGLTFIVASPPLSPLSPEYRSFLERLASESKAQGPIFTSSPPWAGLRITDGGGTCGQDIDSPDFEADEERSLLSVPVTATVSEIYRHCQKYGPAMLAALKQRQEAEADLDTLRMRAERRLRLRRLILDRSLPPQQLRAACLRLCQVPQEFVGLAEGLSLRISAANSVPPQCTHIDIAWDFEL